MRGIRRGARGSPRPRELTPCDLPRHRGVITAHPHSFWLTAGWTAPAQACPCRPLCSQTWLHELCNSSGPAAVAGMGAGQERSGQREMRKEYARRHACTFERICSRPSSSHSTATKRCVRIQPILCRSLPLRWRLCLLPSWLRKPLTSHVSRDGTMNRHSNALPPWHTHALTSEQLLSSARRRVGVVGSLARDCRGTRIEPEVPQVSGRDAHSQAGVAGILSVGGNANASGRREPRGRWAAQHWSRTSVHGRRKGDLGTRARRTLPAGGLLAVLFTDRDVLSCNPHAWVVARDGPEPPLRSVAWLLDLILFPFLQAELTLLGKELLRSLLLALASALAANPESALLGHLVCLLVRRHRVLVQQLLAIHLWESERTADKVGQYAAPQQRRINATVHRPYAPPSRSAASRSRCTRLPW